MTVAELIRRLEAFDQHLEIMFWGEDTNMFIDKIKPSNLPPVLLLEMEYGNEDD